MSAQSDVIMLVGEKVPIKVINIDNPYKFSFEWNQRNFYGSLCDIAQKDIDNKKHGDWVCEDWSSNSIVNFKEVLERSVDVQFMRKDTDGLDVDHVFGKLFAKIQNRYMDLSEMLIEMNQAHRCSDVVEYVRKQYQEKIEPNNDRVEVIQVNRIVAPIGGRIESVSGADNLEKILKTIMCLDDYNNLRKVVQVALERIDVVVGRTGLVKQDTFELNEQSSSENAQVAATKMNSNGNQISSKDDEMAVDDGGEQPSFGYEVSENGINGAIPFADTSDCIKPNFDADEIDSEHLSSQKDVVPPFDHADSQSEDTLSNGRSGESHANSIGSCENENDNAQSIENHNSHFESDETIDEAAAYPSYMLEDPRSEINVEQYTYSRQEYGRIIQGNHEQNRLDRMKAILKHVKPVDGNYNLSEGVPNHKYLLSTFDPRIVKCINLMDSIDPNQRMVWNLIHKRKSTTLVGDMDFISYLPAICDQIYSTLKMELKRRRVLIFASNAEQASRIEGFTTIIFGNNIVQNDFDTPFAKISLENLKYSKFRMLILPLNYISILNKEMEKVCEITETVVIDGVHLLRFDENRLLNTFLSEINNQSDYPNTRRMQIVMTSKHHNHHLYMPRYTLKVVRFVGEGYLDKARFARTHFVMAPFGTFDKRETLKEKLLEFLASSQNSKSAVICNSNEEATFVSKFLKDIGVDCSVNEDATHMRVNTMVLVLTDEYLSRHEKRVTNVINLIHYSLPKEMDEFVRRHFVLDDAITSSWSNQLQKISITSTILVAENFPGTDAANRLILNLMNQFHFSLSNYLGKLRMWLNSAAGPILCLKSYYDLDHLSKCNLRHNRFDLHIGFHYQIEMLGVISPDEYAVRLLMIRQSQYDWTSYNNANNFDQFRRNMNDFYCANFAPISNHEQLQFDVQYILKENKDFSRCTIVEKINDTKVKVKFVDTFALSMYEDVEISDIGHLNHPIFEKFPKQLTVLHIKNLTPMLKSGWDSFDQAAVFRYLQPLMEKKRFEAVNGHSIGNEQMVADDITIHDADMKEKISLRDWLIDTKLVHVHDLITKDSPTKFLGSLSKGMNPLHDKSLDT